MTGISRNIPKSLYRTDFGEIRGKELAWKDSVCSLYPGYSYFRSP